MPLARGAGEALILYERLKAPEEYFIVENRWRRGTFDENLPADGVAVWHVIEDPKLFDLGRPEGSPEGLWHARGIRLVRLNGGKPVDDKAALLQPGRFVDLKWANGSPKQCRTR